MRNPIRELEEMRDHNPHLDMQDRGRLEEVITALRAGLRSLRSDMQHSLDVTVRRDADRYPPDQRRTPLDWVAVRVEVQAWIAEIDRIRGAK